ncbi:DUF397 domain-containing protein [Gandjariella thermophila]|uniref:DUF397 domain-containing protein n=1 Tax=Gandjariella thermophila TaxID=1931992 RepID=A0A4D4J468_9PSEU|nr:DUF397 domain-containing protein [Gandjariella thermophila]GDY29419.1 hypothetical protein GTS_10520 [Gandjariella thermophila]
MSTPNLARARWRRSSRTGGANGGGNCVEVAYVAEVVKVRSGDLDPA